LVRPPGFEPGFLPYCCRSEAVRLMLAGLRRAVARVPVLDQARLRPLAATEGCLIAKALRFHHFLQALSEMSLRHAHAEVPSINRTVLISSTVRGSMGTLVGIQ
jgi:hypothetical protein